MHIARFVTLQAKIHKKRTQLLHNSTQICGGELLVLVSIEQVKSSFEVSDLIVIQQRGGLFAYQVSSAA